MLSLAHSWKKRPDVHTWTEGEFTDKYVTSMTLSRTEPSVSPCTGDEAAWTDAGVHAEDWVLRHTPPLAPSVTVSKS